MSLPYRSRALPVLRRSLGLASALVFLAGTFAACAPSEEQIQQEFEDFVAQRDECKAADECVLVFPDCPLGCFVTVNAEHEEEVKAKAAELVASYQRGGRACAYDCAAPGPLACVAGHCEVESGP